MKKVIVTGSSGKIGRAAMAALKAAGCRVTGVDIKPAEGWRTVIADLTNFGETIGALSGVDMVGGVPDAVVHLAGIPAPGLGTDSRVFRTNSESTYNVFSACARLGIKRVVWASSETILGLPFTTPPDFAPLDESHPDRPSWSYALAKQLGETMADAFVAWHPGMTILSLRFSNVYTREDYANLLAIQAKSDARRFNLWGYVDAEDAGEACRLGIEAALTGHHRMIIAATDTIMDMPSAELMHREFPYVPLRGELGRHTSLLSTARAAALIGYHPRFSWRDRVPA
jgi:nucleoside-diphosphate-sugar epimerase